MIRILATALVLSILLVAPPFVDVVRADPPSKERVRQLLSAIDQMPPETIWRVMGPGTLGVLIELYNDENEPPYVRIRTLSAAAYYPTPAARTFLKAVASTPGQSDLFIRHAVLSLGKAFGAVAITDVQPYLRHRESVVREAAVMSLSRIGTPAAIQLLRARVPSERNTVVREALDRALR